MKGYLLVLPCNNYLVLVTTSQVATKDKNETNMTLTLLKSIQVFNKLNTQGEFEYLNILVGPEAQILHPLNAPSSFPW